MIRRILTISAVLVIGVLVGCAAPPRKADETAFFPPPPELPRVQYLTSFGGLKDIEEQTAFNRFVIGEKENRKLDKPYGVAMHDGKIYVCDTNDKVIVIDLKNKTYGPLKGAHGQGKIMQPLNISISSEGIKYVTDPVRALIVAFDRNDEYLRTYGMQGKWKPVDAAPSGDRLYVVDNQNASVRVFSLKTGELLKSIGDRGEPAERLSRPTNIAIDREGDIYVSDTGRFQIVRYDREGRYKSVIGKVGNNMGHFARPRGLALDREGVLYAVDAAFNNVQLFNTEGRILMFFGEGGNKAGNFILPAKVSVVYDNNQYFQKYFSPDFEVEYLLIVTSQLGDRSVNVFGYGKEKGKPYPSEKELLRQIREKRQQEFEKRSAPGRVDDPEHEKGDTGPGRGRQDSGKGE